jgi:hypothetical protein
MSLKIDTEEGARRLARAILADIALYNGDRVRDADDVAEDLADEIGAGRRLFVTRVAETLAPVYEQELAEWTVKMAERAERAPRPRTYQPTMEREPPLVESERRGSAKSAPLIAAVVVAVVAAASVVGYSLMR